MPRISDVPANGLLLQRLANFFRETLHVDVPSPDTDMIDAGLLDSLQFVQLVLHLEAAFGLHLSLEDLVIDHFRSIVSIATFIASVNS